MAIDDSFPYQVDIVTLMVQDEVDTDNLKGNLPDNLIHWGIDMTTMTTTEITLTPDNTRNVSRARSGNKLLSRPTSRVVHLVFGSAMSAYIYLPDGAVSDVLQVGLASVGVPLVSLSGMWLWKGAALRRAVRQRAAQKLSAQKLSA
jgi:hypothetical protein